MIRELVICTTNLFVAQFEPEEGVDTNDVVRLAQMFVRKHGIDAANASLPDGEPGEQNGFAIYVFEGMVMIRNKCAGESRNTALRRNLQQAFSRVCRAV